MPPSRTTPDACARIVMESIPMVMRFIRKEMRRHSASLLSVPQFRALAFVDRNPGVSLFQVADHLGVTRPTASVIVDRLVRRGMLLRTQDPEERRRIVLRLTPRGARLLQQARKATRSWMAEVLAPLSHETRGQIEKGVSLLGLALRRTNGEEMTARRPSAA